MVFWVECKEFVWVRGYLGPVKGWKSRRSRNGTAKFFHDNGKCPTWKENSLSPTSLSRVICGLIHPFPRYRGLAFFRAKSEFSEAQSRGSYPRKYTLPPFFFTYTQGTHEIRGKWPYTRSTRQGCTFRREYRVNDWFPDEKIISGIFFESSYEVSYY